jgi:hypothetical protein
MNYFLLNLKTFFSNLSEDLIQGRTRRPSLHREDEFFEASFLNLLYNNLKELNRKKSKNNKYD